ncbi:MAG: mechanosensitive ion channel [Streptosporangiales bacterium]|nr:mechanosensitive ion channel [Streptosporangiales bacterium]
MGTATSGWITLVVGVLVAVALLELVRRLVTHRLARRWPTGSAELSPVVRPAFVAAVLAGVRASLRPEMLPNSLESAISHLVTLTLIAAVTWMIVEIVNAASDLYLLRLAQAGEGTRHIQRARTQIGMLRRAAGAIIVVLGFGVALFTFEAVRALGAGVMASAGVLGIVAGIAAQSTLGNLFAGLQLAFSDALRIDDVVVVDGEWGRIEELTLTYVVVTTWDERRLVMPVSYFTTTPFENWTKAGGALLGPVMIRLDWTVPVRELRSALYEWLQRQALWDRREWSLSVTNLMDNGLVELRAVVSAADSASLWDLSCDMREWLIEYVREKHPDALPRFRAEVLPADLYARSYPASAFREPVSWADREAVRDEGHRHGPHEAPPRGTGDGDGTSEG